jgi:hypothetical protein
LSTVDDVATKILQKMWKQDFLVATFKAMGRPRKLPEEKRVKPLRIRLTDEERAFINDAAHTFSLDASAWARSLLLREARNAVNRR